MKLNLQNSMRLALGAVAAFLLPALASANCGVDLPAFDISMGAQTVQNGQVHQTATIKNVGVSLKGPIYLVVSNLPQGVTEYPFTWTANCEPGAQFIRIYLGYENIWITNKTKLVSMNFTANALPVNYSYRVIQGVGLANPHFMPGDFDGDHISDGALYNTATGVWTIKQTTTSTVVTKQFGTGNVDHFVVGDFDGDLKEDYALYRPSAGIWWVIRSSDGGFMSVVLGVPNIEKPVPADYDGDGYTDMAMFNPNTAVWTVKRSSDGQTVTKQFGVVGDIPVVADYDQDGKADFGVFTPAYARFMFEHSNTPNHTVFSIAMEPFRRGIPFAADMNHDGMADMCTYNVATGKVSIFYTGTNINTSVMMPAKGTPVAADFNGDNDTDFAVYDRPTAAWVVDSQMNAVVPVPVLSMTFGNPPDDIPVMTLPAFYW